jgi:C-terminal processing protease CtpA/Prc
LTRVVAALGDGHSGLAPPDVGPGPQVEFRFLGERMVVLRSEVEGVEVGDVVSTLGGRTPAQLVEDVRALFGSENDGHARRIVEIALGSRGIHQLLGTIEDDRVALDALRGSQAVRASLELGTPMRGARSAARRTRPTYDTEANLAVLPLPSMDPRVANRDVFRRFLERVASKDITRIAIDVRENPGGNSQAMLDLVSLLENDGWTSFGAKVRVSPESNGRGRTRGPLGLQEFAGPDHPANPGGFDGEVFVLTSPRTFSSGAWLPVLIQDNELGKVVGEPPGNAPSRPGDVLTFVLPNSGLTLRLPFKDWIRPDPERDPADELTPDVVVVPTVEDLIEGRDPVLERVKSAGSK